MMGTLPMEFVWQILLAAFVGALTGIERDLTGRPSGVRTHIVICVSSCLFTMISIYGFSENADTSRVAAQIVTGVGFLGAGALIHQGSRVMGLTTAADMWLVAAIGMAIGAGYGWLATFVGILIVVLLMGLAPFSHWLEQVGKARMEKKGIQVIDEYETTKPKNGKSR
jgi:putative Mg2+ transporter-C (MgtC) family protein